MTELTPELKELVLSKVGENIDYMGFGDYGVNEKGERGHGESLCVIGAIIRGRSFTYDFSMYCYCKVAANVMDVSHEDMITLESGYEHSTRPDEYDEDWYALGDYIRAQVKELHGINGYLADDEDDECDEYCNCRDHDEDEDSE